MTQTTPDIIDLAREFAADLPHSDDLDPEDLDELENWLEQCATTLLPYFEATEDHRGWETDPDLKLMVAMDTHDWYEPVVEERERTASHVTSDGADETLEHATTTEEVVVDRVLESEVVGYFLKVQADTDREKTATAALANELGLTVTEYGGTHTRFTHRLEHPNNTK